MTTLSSAYLFFFFFQAEDGIRDRDVTGVQTCALPICFDSIGLTFLYRPDVDSGAACNLQLASILGPFPSIRETGGCLRKGAIVAWNPDAAQQARRNVRAQLAELLQERVTMTLVFRGYDRKAL